MGWSRKVEYQGAVYYCSVYAGMRVRIPYKPRGQNIGYRWYCNVVRENERSLYNGPCNKSTGCRGMIEYALHHEFMSAAFGRHYAGQ